MGLLPDWTAHESLSLFLGAEDESLQAGGILKGGGSPLLVPPRHCICQIYSPKSEDCQGHLPHPLCHLVTSDVCTLDDPDV